MTAQKISGAIAAIQARVRAAPVEGSMPIVAEWAPIPPFVAKPNTCASRGHREVDPGQCKACRELKPKGGWSVSCVRDARQFMGDGNA
jgi:hypothetical protein